MRGYAPAFVLCAAASAALMYSTRRWDPPPPEPEIEYYDADPDCAILSQRIAAKERLGARVAEGEVSLAEAVREFLALNRAAPALPENRYDGLPGRSLGERVADRITFAVSAQLAGDPRRERTLDGLACEQAALVAAGESREWVPDRP
jgi:hypothetical protein